MIRNNAFKNETTIFKKVGAQLNEWLLAHVRLDSMDIQYDFKIAIDGIAGSSFQGDISVDESNHQYDHTLIIFAKIFNQVSLLIGQCPPSRVCDFETDLCSNY